MCMRLLCWYTIARTSLVEPGEAVEPGVASAVGRITSARACSSLDPSWAVAYPARPGAPRARRSADRAVPLGVSVLARRPRAGLLPLWAAGRGLSGHPPPARAPQQRVDSAGASHEPTPAAGHCPVDGARRVAASGRSRSGPSPRGGHQDVHRLFYPTQVSATGVQTDRARATP